MSFLFLSFAPNFCVCDVTTMMRRPAIWENDNNDTQDDEIQVYWWESVIQKNGIWAEV